MEEMYKIGLFYSRKNAKLINELLKNDEME